jgi:hypothetical protein
MKQMLIYIVFFYVFQLNLKTEEAELHSSELKGQQTLTL